MNRAEEKAYDIVCDGRRMLRLVQSVLFSTYFERAPESDKVYVVGLVGKLDTLGVSRWLRGRLDLQDKSLVELRALACRQGIPNYHHKSKTDILKELTGAGPSEGNWHRRGPDEHQGSDQETGGSGVADKAGS